MKDAVSCPLLTTVRNSCHRPIVITENHIVNYGEFLNLVAQTVLQLKKYHLKPFDRVALIGPNSLGYLVTMYALWRLKIITCPLNNYLPEKAVAGSMQQINAKVLIRPAAISFETFNEGDTIPKRNWFAKLEQCNLERLGIILPSSNRNSEERQYKIIDFEKITYDCLESPSQHQLSDFVFFMDDPLTIIFTSGSSTQPKGVLHSFGNHYFNALGSNEHIPLNTNSQWLLSLPLYHVGGLSIFFRILLAKASIVIPENQQSILDTLKNHPVTHISLVPVQLYRLLQKKETVKILKKLSAILIGGGPISPSLVQHATSEGLPIHITYGLTEMASQVATSYQLKASNRTLSVRPLNHREVNILDGQILVRGKTLFLGYISKKRLTPPRMTDGWFPTGDLGQWTIDRQLIITGRQDNMFISGGENIQPEEIEHYLLQITEIQNAVVVAKSDKEFGQRPIAFIKFKEGSHLLRATIVQTLGKYLPKFKIPDHFFYWPLKKEEGDMKVKRLAFINKLKNLYGTLIEIE